MKQQLEYYSQGRSGNILYKDELGSIKLYYEFGGADCIAIIFLPAHNEWKEFWDKDSWSEAIDFIAKQVIIDQAPNCYFKIGAETIEILKK